MRRYLIAAILLSSTALVAPAQAQSSAREIGGRDIGSRVDRLEGEMRAVQRKVFPGGNGQYIEPENQPAAPEPILSGSPTSPVADLATRVDSLENQLRELTSQVETNQHRLQLLDARIKTLEANAAPPPAPGGADDFGDAPPPRRPADRSIDSSDDRSVDRPVAVRPTPAKPTPVTAVDRASSAVKDPTRAARIAELERPDSGDTAEDTYLYGYRLWAAKLYPEAEAQFTAVTTKFPTHKRASYAQNLLGRSYLEDGKPSLASLAFYDNYKKWPDGDRAPESLYYLAQALVKLDKPAAQVCKVYAELVRSYGAKVDADPKMKAGVAKGRDASHCS